MTRYADPHRCPDCGAAITPADPSCPTCALSLRGDVASRLFQTLTQADGLLAALRAASVPAARVAAAPAPAGAAFDAAPFPAGPGGQTRHRGLSSASVPKVLLALGAGCLLVAALVFLAVTWSVLGVGGRTATLVGFTAVAFGLTAWMARRGLRAAAESLALVGYGLLSLDVVGADHAGWFGDLSTAGLVLVVGLVLAATGVAGTLGVRRTVTSSLTSGELVAVVGTGLAAFAFGVAEWLPVSPSLAVATLVGATMTFAASRLRTTVLLVGAAAVTAVAWLSLVSVALDRLFTLPTVRAVWVAGHAWPMLTAAVLVAGLALVRALPHLARVMAAGVAALLVILTVVTPALDEGPTPATLVTVAVLVAVGAAGFALPRPWRLGTVPTQVVAAAGLVTLVGPLALSALERLLDPAAEPWSGRPSDALGPVNAGLPAPWLLPVATFVLLATLAAVAESSRLVDRAVGELPALQVSVLTLLTASVVAALALYPVALWLVVGTLLVVVVAMTTWSVVGRTVEPLVPAGLTLAFTLVVSLHAAWLTLAALLVAVAVTATVQLSSRAVALAAASGALAAAGLAATVWTGGHLLGADPSWTALAGLLVLGAAVLGAPYAPGRWWAAERPAQARTGIEAGAAAAALPLALAGLALATEATVATWAAVYLTAAGVVVTAMSLLRPDRRQLGWVGGFLLAAATWVRLWDRGVTTPEAYTLPSAAALLVVGLVHLRRNPTATTMTALAPGLSLALVPSLLWVLAEPTGLRALLLGLACLLLVVGGARLRWTAPVVVGGTVGALLVLRLAAPYIGDAVPRWVLLGGAGALLVAMGVTWERRLQEARHLVSYVRALR